MTLHLTAVFEKVPEGYIGFVPELPGANTQGATLEEARSNLDEAVRLVLEANRTLAEEELARVESFCGERGVAVARARVHANGGAGGLELADRVIAEAESGGHPGFHVLYPLEMPIREKIATIAREVYGADGVEYTRPAERDVERLEAIGLGGLPVCVAKTQYSLSDDPARLGRPRDFHITVNEVRPSAGAGFLVVLTGDIMTMPGLPKRPAAEAMGIDPDGTVHGLF